MSGLATLKSEYPQLFGPWTIHSGCGPGWVALVRPCLDVLAKHGCKVTQIKQKFCGLRVYWDPPEESMYLDKAANDEIDAVIERAEGLSFRTCEECGAESDKPGGPKSGRRLCAECRLSDLQTWYESDLKRMQQLEVLRERQAPVIVAARAWLADWVHGATEARASEAALAAAVRQLDEESKP